MMVDILLMHDIALHHKVKLQNKVPNLEVAIVP